MLTAAGLPDLITTSLEEYEELAVKLGKDHQGFMRLRSSWRARERRAHFLMLPRGCATLRPALYDGSAMRRAWSRPH